MLSFLHTPGAATMYVYVSLRLCSAMQSDRPFNQSDLCYIYFIIVMVIRGKPTLSPLVDNSPHIIFLFSNPPDAIC